MIGQSLKWVGALFCSVFAVGAHAVDAPRFSQEDIAPFLDLPKSFGGLQPFYGTLSEVLRSMHTDLEIRFVVGAADPKFLTVAPELWSPDYDYESFSKASAFGRTLCPGHPRNKGKNYVIVIRADDPGDTLVHEYLHYLQAKRPASALCALYEKLESSNQPDDLLANSAAEYEVVRFLYENREALRIPLEAKAALLEKLATLQALPNPRTSVLLRNYGWKRIEKAPLQKEMASIVSDVKKDYKELPDYAFRSKEGLKAKKTPEKVKTLPSGIAVLDRKPLSLPLCIELQIPSEKWKTVAGDAINFWNEGAQKALGHPAFKTADCGKSQVQIVWDMESGRLGDGVLKLGQAYALESKNPAFRVVLRDKEILSYGRLLAAVSRSKLATTPSKDRPDLAAKLASFSDRKLNTIVLNIVMHELGHVLGLAHNFNSGENSIMDYSDHVTLADYDLDALRAVYGKAAQRKWAAQLTPPQQAAYPGN